MHRGTTTDTGTLPAAGVSVSATSPSQIATGGDTNRIADTTIGASAQTSNVLTTLANQNAQPSLILRCVSAPIGAQTIAAQLLTFGVGGSDSNTNSNFNIVPILAVWRPSTGSLVGHIWDGVGGGGGGMVVGANSTTQVWSANNNTADNTTSVTSQDGDIIVFEWWRYNGVQSMSTAYTNTVFYDGTTEGSATNSATFLNFPNTITFSTGRAFDSQQGSLRDDPFSIQAVQQAVNRAATY